MHGFCVVDNEINCEIARHAKIHQKTLIIALAQFLLSMDKMWAQPPREEVKRLYPNYESAEQEFIQSIDFDATTIPKQPF